MIALLRSLCVGIAIAGALVAVFAAAGQNQTLMGISGLVAAVAALLWGLLMWVYGDDSDTEPDPVDDVAQEPHSWAERDLDGGAEWILPDYSFGSEAHGRGMNDLGTTVPIPANDGDELPYRPVGKRPFWDTTVFGAPE